MPSVDREGSSDREMVLSHQHSFSSESTRSSIPMWDSSDPDRAPPPLPMNPNPNSPGITTRPNTSANIQAAAEALAQRAKVSAGVAAYTSNPSPERSPERSLVKGAAHRRMQSLQPGKVGDFKSYLEGTIPRSPDKSPEKGMFNRTSTPTFSRDEARDYLSYSRDASPTRSGTPTPIGRDLLKDTPSLRPSSRPPPKAILGENTPPSATMLALQTMPVKDYDPPNFSKDFSSASPGSTIKIPPGLEASLAHLTAITTGLKQEMSALSRRSKDNATDLISLKEATNSRDEDIRRTLKELVTKINIHGPAGLLDAPGLAHSTSSFSLNSAFLDPKEIHGSPPSITKSFTLPRIPSPASFLDSEATRIGSPSPYSVEGAASVAMLEKIIREMVTKDGQERLLKNLSELLEKANGTTAKKVEELADFIKKNPSSQALVPMGVNGGHGAGTPGFERDFALGSGPLTRTTRELDTTADIPPGRESQKPYSSPRAADFVNDDMLKMLRKIKDSVEQSGCMTAETKALTKQLRGEVLGMGRDIGRKIEETFAAKPRGDHLAIEDGREKDHVSRIITEGLTDLKKHMEQVIRENRRQSNSTAISRNTVDSQEVYEVVKHAIARQDGPGFQGVDKEAIVAAVKEAYETCKPEIAIEQYGLERDEVLQCLKEGLEEFHRPERLESPPSITKEEIMDTIEQGLQSVNLPQPPTEASEVQEELLSLVRECLEEIRSSPRKESRAETKEDMLAAIKEGLASHGPNAPREFEINREDLYQAIKAALEDGRSPFGSYGQEVLNELNQIVDNMHHEFKQYSAANGRDTEQVLDAVKDGLESLRTEIESYVDRAQDVTGKDEIIDTVRMGLENLRVDVEGFVKQGPTGDNSIGRAELLEYLKAEFEHVHAILNDAQSSGQDKQEILTALREGFEGLKSQVTVKGSDNEEEIGEALKDEFEQLREAILSGTAAQKDDILETLQESLNSLHGRLGEKGVDGEEGNEVLDTMKEEFGHLRETLATIIVKSGGGADRDDIIDGVRECVDSLRTQLASDQSTASAEMLGSVKEELEHLRETLGSTLIRTGGDGDREEILELLRSGLDDIRAASGSTRGEGENGELLETIRGELEHLKQHVGASLQHQAGNHKGDTDEILDAVRIGLDDLRSHFEKKLDNPEHHTRATGEVIDAFNEGIEGLRADVAKMVQKPVDETVSYEILDTLREGLASLRMDIDKLKSGREDKFDGPITPTGNEVVLAEDPETVAARELNIDVPAENPVSSTALLKMQDLEKIEGMLSQLQVKVDDMDANIKNQEPPAPPPAPTPAPAPQPAEGTAMKVDLASIEESLRELQASVNIWATREPPDTEKLATKEDTDAIETLLRNAKATLDEMVLPDPAVMVSKEHIDALEVVVRMVHDAVEGVDKKLEGAPASKEDVAVVEVLVGDVKTAVDDLKAIMPIAEDAEKKVTKEDLDSLGIAIMDVKSRVNDIALAIPDPAELPAKADVEQLSGLILDFRESHDKMKDGYETDIAITAKAFDDRRKESEAILEGVSEMKVFLEDVKEELKSKMQEGGEGIDALGVAMKGLEEAMGSNSAVTADVKELMEIVNREFERAHGSLEGIKLDDEARSVALLESQAEQRAALIAEVSTKLDERFDQLMVKYDDAQTAAAEAAKSMEEKAGQQEEVLSGTKVMAEELKLTIDTLGSTMTEFTSSFTETTTKLSDDSKTVFERVDDTLRKLDEGHADNKNDHQLTRDEIAKIFPAVSGLQSEITGIKPEMLETLQEVLRLVNQHYEHSQKAQENAAEQARKVEEAVQEQARIATEETSRHLAEVKTTFEGLPALLPPPALPPPPPEKYDDAELQNKVDKLLEQATEAGKATAQLEKLDLIQQQVERTAAEVATFVALQTQRITEDHENKEKEAEEVALLLERRITQKEQLESDITGLNEEKDSIQAVIEALRAERDALTAQKSRLTADVASLETALHIRRDELHIMDAKADALERRILDGIMNHSRAMLLTKQAQTPAKPKRDLRVTSNASGSSTSTVAPLPSSLNNGHNLVMKTRPQVRRSAVPQDQQRRIMSLNQITSNVPTGSKAFSYAPSVASSQVSSLKRSQSVKTHFTGMRRKSSLGMSARRSVSDMNKENETLSEEDEEYSRPASRDSESILESETGTERRGSYAPTESGMTYGTGSEYTGSLSDGRTPGADSRLSYGVTESDLSYGTGSYLTGSEVDRRTSFGSTVRSRIDDGTVLEEDEEEEVQESVKNEPVEEREAGADAGDATVTQLDGETPGQQEEEEDFKDIEEDHEAQVIGAREGDKKDIVLYSAPSDSGLGSELPTAAIEPNDRDYFRRLAEEQL